MYSHHGFKTLNEVALWQRYPSPGVTASSIQGQVRVVRGMLALCNERPGAWNRVSGATHARQAPQAL